MCRFDYLNDESELVIGHHTTMLEGLYDSLKREGVLCSVTGSLIVSVYRFKGDYNEVLIKFRNYIDRVKNIQNLTESIRQDLYIKHGMINNYENPNPYWRMVDEIKKIHYSNITPDDIAKQNQLICKAIENEKILHDKKECLCFSNF